MEDDGYDAYGIIQSFPLKSECYVVLDYADIDFLINSLQTLKSQLEKSTAVGNRQHFLLP